MSTKLPDPSIVNSPIAEESILADTWRHISEASNFFMSHSPAETKAWYDTNRYMATYTLVYRYCVSPRTPGDHSSNGGLYYGEKLYIKLEEWLRDTFGRIAADLAGLTDNWTRAVRYQEYWERCWVASRHIEAMLMYMERSWLEKNQSVKIGGAHPERIRQLVLLRWYQAVVAGQSQSFLEQVLQEQFRRERSGMSDGEEVENQRREMVKKIMIGLDTLSNPIQPLTAAKPEPNKVKIWLEVVEPLYLKLIEDHLVQVLPSVGTLEAIKTIWDAEIARAAFYLPEKSKKAVRDCLKDHLFSPLLPVIRGAFEAALRLDFAQKQETVQGVRIVFDLLSLRRALLTNLDESLETVVTARLMEAGQAAGGAILDTLSIIEMYNWVTDIVNAGMDGRESALSSRDKAFRVWINSSKSGRMGELLAGQIDSLLRNTSADANEAMARLEGFLAFFKLLDDKEAFRGTYARLLSHRLLAASGRLWLDGERFVVDQFKLICGVGYSSAMAKMVSDISSVGEAMAVFEGGQAADYEIIVLTGGSWPLTANSYPFSWPEKMKGKVQQFEAFYKGKNQKKKLDWLPQYSRVEVAFGTNGEYTLAMTALQYCLLEQLTKEGGAIPTESLIRQTNLPIDIVGTELERLVRTGLVKEKKGAGDRVGYFIDPEFTSEHTTIYLSDNIHVQGLEDDRDIVMSDGSNDDGFSEEKRKYLYQSIIVRICKSAKKIAVKELLEQVLAYAQRWVPSPLQEEIVAQVEVLISREFLVRQGPEYIEYQP